MKKEPGLDEKEKKEEGGGRWRTGRKHSEILSSFEKAAKRDRGDRRARGVREGQIKSSANLSGGFNADVRTAVADRR